MLFKKLLQVAISDGCKLGLLARPEKELGNSDSHCLTHVDEDEVWTVSLGNVAREETEQ